MAREKRREEDAAKVEENAKALANGISGVLDLLVDRKEPEKKRGLFGRGKADKNAAASPKVVVATKPGVKAAAESDKAKVVAAKAAAVVAAKAAPTTKTRWWRRCTRPRKRWIVFGKKLE